MNWHEVINSLAQFYAESASAIEHNPPELCVPAGAADLPLAKIVRAEWARAVFRWPHWLLLLQNSANGYVQPPSSTARTARRVTTPTRSDDLLRPFEQSVIELDRFTRAQAGAAIDRLLQNLAEKVQPLRDELGIFCQNAAMRDQLKEKVGSECADLVDVLHEAADPLQLSGRLRSICLGPGMAIEPSADFTADTEPIPPLRPSAIFPLPIGLKFGWNEEVWRELSPDQRCDHTHQSWVPRIRDTLISSVNEALYGLVVEINARAVRNLCRECNELSFLLQNEIVANNQDFVTALAQVLAPEAWLPRIHRAAA